MVRGPSSLERIRNIEDFSRFSFAAILDNFSHTSLEEVDNKQPQMEATRLSSTLQLGDSIRDLLIPQLEVT